MAKPADLSDAPEALGPGVTPVYADASDLALDVRTPSGQQFSIDDPRLIAELREGVRERHS